MTIIVYMLEIQDNPRRLSALSLAHSKINCGVLVISVSSGSSSAVVVKRVCILFLLLIYFSRMHAIAIYHS